MSEQKNVFKYTDVKLKNVIYSESVKTKNGDYVFSKIWYKHNKQVQTLNIQTPYFEIHEVIEDGNSLILLPESQLEAFFESLDELTINFIKSNNLITKYGLRNLSYKTTINDLDGLSVFKAKIVNKQRPPHFYLAKNKQRIDHNNVDGVFENANRVKLILEIDGLIIDFAKKIMYTNVVVRQVLISEIEPKRIELETNSFIESDGEKDKDDSEIILDVQQSEQPETKPEHKSPELQSSEEQKIEVVQQLVLPPPPLVMTSESAKPKPKRGRKTTI